MDFLSRAAASGLPADDVVRLLDTALHINSERAAYPLLLFIPSEYLCKAP
jgi:hypothetical protein